MSVSVIGGDPIDNVHAPTESDAIRRYTERSHSYLSGITHQDTGAYARAQSYSVEGNQGTLFVDPTFSYGTKHPADYAVYEEARGGEHAAYARTVKEYMEPHIGDLLREIAEEAVGE